MKGQISRYLATILFLSANHSFADPVHLEGKYLCADGYFSFTSEEFITYLGDSESAPVLEKEKYSVSLDEGFTVVVTENRKMVAFAFDGFMMLVIKNNGNKNLWTLTGDGLSSEYSEARFLFPVKIIRASSFLVEKLAGRTIQYNPQGFFVAGSIPWVPQQATNQTIQFSVPYEKRDRTKEIEKLYIFNGFFDFDHLDLYAKNSKMKKCTIEYQGAKDEFLFLGKEIVETVKLSKPIDPNQVNSVTLRIADSLPGTKYSDIGISMVYWPEVAKK